MTTLKRYLRARRVAKYRRAADELALVIFWSEPRRAER